MTDFLRDRRVLVTGAGGFIGSHLAETLVAQGAQVRAFVRYNSRGDLGLLGQLPAQDLQKIEVIAGDLRDPHAVRTSVLGCDMVFHLGALISIPYSFRHPRDAVETNFLGTLNVALACRDLEVGRLIHTSTSEVYGTAITVPIDEGHPLQAQSPYAASKIGADKLVESFCHTYELPAVTVRPFNTFGPRQSARAVIPTIITQALTADVVRLGALDTRRDFTFVKDTVQGFLQAAQTAGIEGQTFNLGTGQDVRIGDLAQTIIELIDRPLKIEVDPSRLRPKKSMVRRLLSNNQIARQALGWEPQFSLAEGLSQTIAWIREHLYLYRPGVYEF